MVAIIKSKIWVQIFLIYTRYLIGVAFVFASIVKIKGERFMVDMTMINNSPYHSMGHMFETLYQSGLYWKFIGFSQLFAAFLLMTQRYSRLGAIVFFPIMLNIFFITISYEFKVTTYITGLMLLANLLLLIWEWSDLKVLLNLRVSQDLDTKFSIEDLKIWEISGLILFIFTAVWRNFINSFPDVLIWIAICFIIGSTTLLIGIRLYKIKNRNTLLPI